MATAQDCSGCGTRTVSRSKFDPERPLCAKCRKTGAVAPAPIRPLPAGKPIAPYRAPQIRRSDFTHIPGQGAMDLSSDDPDAIVWED